MLQTTPAQIPEKAPGPPGLALTAFAVAAVLLALDGSSRRSLGVMLLSAPLWLGVAVVWLLRFLAAANAARWRFPVSVWARWAFIPVALGAVSIVAFTEVPFEARLALSRGAMDQMAAEVAAGGSANRGWVGLYDTGTVLRTENGVRFVVDDSSLGRWGFAYSTSGEPIFIDDEEEDAGLWTGAWFESIGGGWWKWTQAWD